MDTELELMREQMNMLKAEVDKNAKISDAMMHDTIKQRTEGARRQAIMGLYGFLPICLIFFPYLFAYSLGLSWWFAIISTLLICLNHIEVYYRNYMRTKNIMDGSLENSARALADQNKMSITKLAIEIPVSLIWIAWFILELMHAEGGLIVFPIEMMPLVYKLGVALGIIGLALGISFITKQMKANKELIKLIDDLNKIEHILRRNTNIKEGVSE